MDRKEHLEWCKIRALEYINNGDVFNAWTSMITDLKKHEETKDHTGIMLGMTMIMNGQLSAIGEMEKFIKRFN